MKQLIDQILTQSRNIQLQHVVLGGLPDLLATAEFDELRRVPCLPRFNLVAFWNGPYFVPERRRRILTIGDRRDPRPDHVVIHGARGVGPAHAHYKGAASAAEGTHLTPLLTDFALLDSRPHSGAFALSSARLSAGNHGPTVPARARQPVG